MKLEVYMECVNLIDLTMEQFDKDSKVYQALKVSADRMFDNINTAYCVQARIYQDFIASIKNADFELCKKFNRKDRMLLQTIKGIIHIYYMNMEE